MSFDFETIKYAALIWPAVFGFIFLALLINSLVLAFKGRRRGMLVGGLISASIFAVALSIYVSFIIHGGFSLLLENEGDAVTVDGVISELEESALFTYPTHSADVEGYGSGPSAGVDITIGELSLSGHGSIYHRFSTGDDVTVTYLPKSGYILSIVHTDGVGQPVKMDFDYGENIFRNCLLFPTIFGIITALFSLFLVLGTVLMIKDNDRFKEVCASILVSAIAIFFVVWNSLILYNGGFALFTERNEDALVMTGEITEMEDVSTFVFSYTSTDYGSGDSAGSRLTVNGIELKGPGVIGTSFDVGDTVTVIYMPKSGYIVSIHELP